MDGGHIRRIAAVAATLCLALAGCFGPGRSWRIPDFMHPAPPPTPHHYQPSAGSEINNIGPPSEEEEPAARAVHPRRATEHAEPAAAPAAPAPQPLPMPTVTLADGPSKETAQRMLDEAGAKLARIDRGKLGADRATTYDQANNFLQAGRKAAADQDYVAASGFAQKAALLAAKLASSGK